MIEFKGNIFKMGLRACRKKKYSFDLEEKLKSSSIRISKDVIYLNDFYDLLYEKEEKEIIENQNPPKYFKSEKFYTMGPGIDFPLVMNYRAEEHSPFTLHASRSTTNYFYFLNGHGDVTYFADQNFTEEQIETYEYTPWGVLLTSANKNNLIYTAREFDFDVGLQFNRMRYYNPNLGRFAQKDLIWQNNYFIYAENSPLNYLDPFGLYRIGGMIPAPFMPEAGICCSGLPDPRNDPAARCARCQLCCDRLFPEIAWWCYTMSCIVGGCCNV